MPFLRGPSEGGPRQRQMYVHTSFPRVIRLCAVIRFLKTTTQLVFFNLSKMRSDSVAIEQCGSLVRFIRSVCGWSVKINCKVCVASMHKVITIYRENTSPCTCTCITSCHLVYTCKGLINFVYSGDQILSTFFHNTSD